MQPRATPRTIDYWFDYTCPYAYLGSTQIEALASRTGAALRWRPFLLGGVFRAVGTAQNLSETLPPAKARHNARDVSRWADLFGTTVRWPAGHPQRSVEALRATLATGIDPRVIHGFFRAYWVDNRPISAPDTVRDVVTAAGHDAEAVLARLADDSLRDDLRARTDKAIALGIFGAPATVVDGQPMYWGQDRLHLVEGSDAVYRLAPGAVSQDTVTPGKTVEIYWDFSSPFAYLGSVQAEALAARTAATLVWRPMLLGGLFRSIGQANVPMATWSAARQKYTLDDLARTAVSMGVPFRFPSRFPMNTILPLRVWLALPESRRDAFRADTFRAYWADDRDISAENVLADILGTGAGEILDRARTPAVKQSLIDATTRAESAGVFGAPTWIVDGTELFWGQDRVPLVERCLRRPTA